MPTFAQPNLPLGTDRGAAETTDSTPEMPSLWLYIAGFCVTMSGLFAINFSLYNPGFSMLTYGLAAAGYVTSYILRLRGLTLNSVKTPLLVGLALILLAAISSGQGMEWLLPVEDPNDRAKALQLLFAWGAILHTFTLATDAAVLFACVPCMTMIALASTQGTESELLNSFLVFVGASTFLMIHENYLRTKNGKVIGRTAAGEKRLFGGQMQLAGFCVIAALLLANFVAVPISRVGQSLSLAGNLPNLNSGVTPQQQQQSLNVAVNELNELDITAAGDAQSDTVLFQVRSSRGLYLRGTTFDEYTGQTFKNNFRSEETIQPWDGPSDDIERYRRYADITDASQPSRRHFRLPISLLELPDEQMQDSQDAFQDVKVVGGRQNNFYGAGRVKFIRSGLRTIRVTSSGSMQTPEGIGLNDQYRVTSRVPSEEERVLRAASGQPIPDIIQRTYLQTATANGSENPRLRELADTITSGLTNAAEKVSAIKTYIEQNCKYNLQADRAPRDRDIVEYFLTVAKEGDCKPFASAMVMLSRYAGLPARMASGFLQGDFEPKENMYIVRQKHKHVWAEVFFPGVGWVTYDATEGAEDISDRSNRSGKNKGFFAWLFSQGGGTLVVGVICAGLLGYVIKTELLDRLLARRRPLGEALSKPQTNLAIIAAYAEANRALLKRGLKRPEHLTPEEFAREILERNAGNLPGLATPLAALTTLFTRYRYSAETATEDEVRQAKEASAALRQALQEAKRAAINRVPVHSTT
jgi:transglutaminase-like putative cysteine protease